MQTLDDLLKEQIRDLLDAEKRIIKALPKLAKAASNPELRSAFENHLDETKVHLERLEQVCTLLEMPLKSKTCHGIKGLLEEGDEVLKEKKMDPDVRDAALIASAQRVEHYEMAGYDCSRTFAKVLGYAEVENLLQQTLDEEGNADHLLTEIAEGFVNAQAA